MSQVSLPEIADLPSEPAAITDSPEGGCPLTWPEQRRNLVLFATCTGMQYLAAPVLYVGITQAALCERLGADTRTANLPATLFFAMTAMPALIAWLFPQVSVLKRNLTLCYVITAAMQAAIALALLFDVPREVKLGMVILQGGVAGAVMPAAVAFLWELIGRGSDEKRRGLALSLAFGAGPLLAVAGSFGQTCLLGGELFGWKFAGYPYPWNFVALFGAGVPVMLFAAVLARFFVVPPIGNDVRREPVSSVYGLLGGLGLMFAAVALLQLGSGHTRGMSQNVGMLLMVLAACAFIWHFRPILQQRVLFLATIVTILVYAGNTIPSNMNLYSMAALGDTPEKYAGLQNMLRFSFKVVTGVCLGWMLMRTNPRAGILATSLIFLTSQIWAMLVTGPWYLVAFGIYGAGELVGVYAPNYIVSASRQAELRRNLAFVTMLMAPAAPAGYLFGAIVDGIKSRDLTFCGVNSTALGFRLSFLACSLFILAGIVIAATLLPKQPRPEHH